MSYGVTWSFKYFLSEMYKFIDDYGYRMGHVLPMWYKPFVSRSRTVQHRITDLLVNAFYPTLIYLKFDGKHRLANLALHVGYRAWISNHINVKLWDIPLLP